MRRKIRVRAHKRKTRKGKVVKVRSHLRSVNTKKEIIKAWVQTGKGPKGSMWSYSEYIRDPKTGHLQLIEDKNLSADVIRVKDYPFPIYRFVIRKNGKIIYDNVISVYPKKMTYKQIRELLYSITNRVGG